MTYILHRTICPQREPHNWVLEPNRRHNPEAKPNNMKPARLVLISRDALDSHLRMKPNSTIPASFSNYETERTPLFLLHSNKSLGWLYSHLHEKEGAPKQLGSIMLFCRLVQYSTTLMEVMPLSCFSVATTIVVHSKRKREYCILL